MIRRPPRSTQSRSSAASDVYKRQGVCNMPLLSLSFIFFSAHYIRNTIYDILYTNYSLWIKMPLRSLGSNQVDLGGISLSASATFISSPMEVGYKEKATFIPAFTLFSNSSKPLIPPTNSILWSVRGSFISKIGVSKLFCSIDTSRLSTTSSSLKVPGFVVNLYQELFRYIPKVCFASGLYGSSLLYSSISNFSETFLKNSSSVLPHKSATTRL